MANKQLARVIDTILAAHPDKVAGTRLRPRNIGWFYGQVMKATDGYGHPVDIFSHLAERIFAPLATKDSTNGQG